MIIFDSTKKNHSIRNSKGNQEKIVINDVWYKLDYLGFESASEEFVSTLLKKSNISFFVDYQMDDISWNGKIFKCCKSNNFVPTQCDLITLDDILVSEFGFQYNKKIENLSTEDKIKIIVDTVKNKTGLSYFGKYLTILSELDAFILNEDRHFQNITFFKDIHGNYSYAPIFDNGAAFCSDLTMDYDLQTPLQKCINKVKAKPFSNNFQKQVSILESFYGKQLQIEKENTLLEDVLKRIEERYSKQIATRIKLIYFLQQQKYPDICVEKINRRINFLNNQDITIYERE